MKLLVLALAPLLVGVVICDERNSKDTVRPQPRQLFRDGFDSPQPTLSKRRTLQNMRRRQEELSRTGRIPLAPNPKYDNEEFTPEEQRQPEGTEIQAYDDSNTVFADEENVGQDQPPIEEYPEYLEENKLTEQKGDARNEDVKIEEDYPHETRSPAHRYPDEEEITTSTVAEQAKTQSTSSSDKNEEQLTTPSFDTQFRPFDNLNFNDPPVKNTNEHFEEFPSKFNFATNRFRANRFSKGAAEQRTIEEEPFNSPTREIQHRQQIESRSSPRFQKRPQYNQQLAHNLIPEDPFYEEQHRPKRPIRHPRPPQQHQEPQYEEPPADYPDYEDQPDRLSELLLVSQFSCVGRKDGYYADEDVHCEVFHFCQDNVKHSWLCPNDAAFHQVHLICMPRSEDNICLKSSKFHFVNDFLYKEVGDTPENRGYAERYYPQGYESGIDKIPDYNGEQPPQAVVQNRNRHFEGKAAPPSAYLGRQQFFKPRNEEKDQPERKQQGPPFRPRIPRPIPEEAPLEPIFREQEVRNPNFLENKKPQFTHEEKIFENPRNQFRPQPEQVPEHPQLSFGGGGFRPFQAEEPKFSPPTFEHRPRPPIGNQERELQQFRPPQFHSPEALPSNRHQQFRPNSEGRRFQRRESPINPLSMFG